MIANQTISASPPQCPPPALEAFDRRGVISPAGEWLPREPAGLSLLPVAPWVLERAKLLHTICRHVERRLPKDGILRAARRFARRWNGRSFRCEPTRKLRLGGSTLVRFFYQWKKAGRCPAAFQLHFQAGTAPVPGTLVEMFAKACQAEGVTSMRTGFDAVVRHWERGHFVGGLGKLRDWLKAHGRHDCLRGRTPKFPFRYSTFVRRLPDDLRVAIRRAHRARKLVAQRERELKTAMALHLATGGSAQT